MRPSGDEVAMPAESYPRLRRTASPYLYYYFARYAATIMPTCHHATANERTRRSQRCYIVINFRRAGKHSKYMHVPTCGQTTNGVSEHRRQDQRGTAVCSAEVHPRVLLGNSTYFPGTLTKQREGQQPLTSRRSALASLAGSLPVACSVLTTPMIPQHSAC